MRKEIVLAKRDLTPFIVGLGFLQFNNPLSRVCLDLLIKKLFNIFKTYNQGFSWTILVLINNKKIPNQDRVYKSNN